MMDWPQKPQQKSNRRVTTVKKNLHVHYDSVQACYGKSFALNVNLSSYESQTFFLRIIFNLFKFLISVHATSKKKKTLCELMFMPRNECISSVSQVSLLHFRYDRLQTMQFLTYLPKFRSDLFFFEFARFI